MFWTGFLTATVFFATAVAGYIEYSRPYWRSATIKPFEMTPARQKVISNALKTKGS